MTHEASKCQVGVLALTVGSGTVDPVSPEVSNRSSAALTITIMMLLAIVVVY